MRTFLTGISSIFNEIDIEKELCSQCLFHFLMSLTHNRNYARRDLFHFLTSLTQNVNYAHRVVSWFNELETKESILKRVSTDV